MGVGVRSEHILHFDCNIATWTPPSGACSDLGCRSKRKIGSSDRLPFASGPASSARGQKARSRGAGSHAAASGGKKPASGRKRKALMDLLDQVELMVKTNDDGLLLVSPPVAAVKRTAGKENVLAMLASGGKSNPNSSKGARPQSIAQALAAEGMAIAPSRPTGADAAGEGVGAGLQQASIAERQLSHYAASTSGTRPGADAGAALQGPALMLAQQQRGSQQPLCSFSGSAQMQGQAPDLHVQSSCNASAAPGHQLPQPALSTGGAAGHAQPHVVAPVGICISQKASVGPPAMVPQHAAGSTAVALGSSNQPPAPAPAPAYMLMRAPEQLAAKAALDDYEDFLDQLEFDAIDEMVQRATTQAPPHMHAAHAGPSEAASQQLAQASGEGPAASQAAAGATPKPGQQGTEHVADVPMADATSGHALPHAAAGAPAAAPMGEPAAYIATQLVKPPTPAPVPGPGPALAYSEMAAPVAGPGRLAAAAEQYVIPLDLVGDRAEVHFSVMEVQPGDVRKSLRLFNHYKVRACA